MLPSHPTLTGNGRADDCDDQFLGLVHSLVLRESHSANSILGGRSRLTAHSHDIGSQVIKWHPSVESTGALESFYLFPTANKKKWKIKDKEIPCKFSNQIFPRVFGAPIICPEGPPWLSLSTLHEADG